jgi:hypothetical protein
VNRPAERGVVKFKDAHILRSFVLHDEKTHAARLDGGEDNFLEDADLTIRMWEILATSPKSSWRPARYLSI